MDLVVDALVRGVRAGVVRHLPLAVAEDAQRQEPGLVDDLVSSFELLQPVTHSRRVRNGGGPGSGSMRPWSYAHPRGSAPAGPPPRPRPSSACRVPSLTTSSPEAGTPVEVARDHDQAVVRRHPGGGVERSSAFRAVTVFQQPDDCRAAPVRAHLVDRSSPNARPPRGRPRPARARRRGQPPPPARPTSSCVGYPSECCF